MSEVVIGSISIAEITGVVTSTIEVVFSCRSKYALQSYDTRPLNQCTVLIKVLIFGLILVKKVLQNDSKQRVSLSKVLILILYFSMNFFQ